MARKEDVAQIAQKMMYQQNNIRNIGTVAHIDHGKCVAPETRMQLADGSTIEAERVYDKASLLGKKALEDGEKIVYAMENGFDIFSLNKNTGKVEIKKISHAWKLKGGRLLKIRLRNKFEIATTPEHKYLLFDGVDFIEKTASELHVGERIVAGRKVEPIPAYNLKEKILRLLASEPFYAILERNIAENLKKEILKKGIEKVSSIVAPEIKAKSFYHGCYRNRYKLGHLVRLIELLDISPEKIYDSIERICYRTCKNSSSVKLPQTFEDLYYLAGLFVGDGSHNRFVVGKKELENRFISICGTLGIKPIHREYAGKTKELAVTKSLMLLLHCLFDYPLKKKSHNVRISEFLASSPSNLVSRFISGYFDCDGTVEKSRKAVSLSSASWQMLKDLQLLLMRFGCTSILNSKKMAIYITGESIRNFNENIGFSLVEKQQRAMSIGKNIDGSTVCDCVPCDGIRKLRESMHLSKAAVSHHYYKYENAVYAPVRGTYKNLMKMILKESRIATKSIDELAFIEIENIEEIERETVYDFTVPENHNFLAEGIFIHNTTLSDNLVAAAGLISKELAGKQQFMDYYELEQERGITINAANVSMVHNVNGEDYLINLIDTPGHVDFGGEVIRAMRAVDGVILVVDSVEGVMPQTETVIRQALREKVKPSLFINKVDRLVNELQLTEQQMQERFIKTITQVNALIKRSAADEFKEKWQVRVQDGSVTFGSAYNNWALNSDTIAENKMGFKEVYEYCKNGKQKELAQKTKLHSAVLGMVVKHLPSPLVSQKYRIPTIWTGDLQSEEGKAMMNCDPKGPIAMMVNDVAVDPHAGDVATGRIYSGTIRRGTLVKLIGMQKDVSVQQVCLYMGPERITVDEIPAGNIAAIVGIREVYAGETISTSKIKEFESFMTTVEPVMTVSVEPKSTKDLPKLIEVIRQITKEDPNVKAALNQETGEHLLSGMGELHLEITQYRIETDHKVPIQVSTPIVVYKETIAKSSATLEGKSPNKHNKFKLRVEPMEEEIRIKLIEARLQGKVREKDKEIVPKLMDIGFSRDEAKSAWAIHNNNILIDESRGVQNLNEVKELVVQGFMDAMNEGPLAKERCIGIKVYIDDANLHEDAIHRGPAQVLPAVTRTIYACMLSADALLLEPKQLLTINVPQDYMGSAAKELGARRTQINEMRTEGDTALIIAKAPVKELIGFSAAIRSATQGRAVWTAEYAGYEKLPRELQAQVVKETRQRKGMDIEVKPYQFFLES